MIDSGKRFRPKDISPHTAVYRVYHYAHRMPHMTIIKKGEILPECRICRARVSFSPMVAAEPIEDDPDFQASMQGLLVS